MGTHRKIDWRIRPRGNSLIYYKKDRVTHRASSLVSPGVVSLKMSTAEPYTVRFRVLSRKKSTSFNVLFENWYLLDVKRIQATPTKHDVCNS